MLYATVTPYTGVRRARVIAHEMQHAIEVLESDAASERDIDDLFEQIGVHTATSTVETDDAGRRGCGNEGTGKPEVMNIKCSRYCVHAGRRKTRTQPQLFDDARAGIQAVHNPSLPAIEAFEAAGAAGVEWPIAARRHDKQTWFVADPAAAAAAMPAIQVSRSHPDEYVRVIHGCYTIAAEQEALCAYGFSARF